MIRDLLNGYREPEGQPDVCIVGAGAAGLVLAVELLRHGRSVVMLEGGGITIEPASQEPYQSELTGQPHCGIHSGRIRAVGGTTLKWGGQILELDESDFQARPGVPMSGWPISKSSLTRFYARALELEGLADVTRVDDDVWSEIGVGSSAPCAFDHLIPYLTRWCPQPNFAVLHHETLTQKERLMLWQHANAVELLFEQASDPSLVTGVRARTLTGVEAIFRARQYVFAMGAIESSRFLLQPHASNVPWNRSCLLGKHFQDHLDANVATVVPRDPAAFHRCFDNIYSRGFKYHPKLRLSPIVQSQRRTLNVSATMVFEDPAQPSFSHLKVAARQILRGQPGSVAAAHLVPAARHLPLLLRHGWRYAAEHRAYNPPTAAIRLRVHCEQQPDSASTITLGTERDSLGLLRARLQWSISERELQSMRALVLVARDSFAGFAEIAPDQDLFSGDPAFRLRCDDSNHHMGGTRMSATEQNGVVDPNLRLWGTKNVFLLSSSVFPSSGYSNPTHTLLALAVRLAEHLR